MSTTVSPSHQAYFDRAEQLLPGGVNSPVRAFRAVQGDPVVIQRAEGAYIYDIEENQYVDYVGSWGPMILGHSHPKVLKAVHQAVDHGLSFGAPCQGELTLAEKIAEMVPSMEMMRLVSSGTEACMSAIRLARGATGRDSIIKFEGCYHGHSDGLLAKAGSGALTFGEPDSAGVPQGFTQTTITLPFNDLQAVTKIFETMPDQIAAVILEPVAGNMGVIPPQPGFLEGLRSLCDRYQSLLIFDEVMTGFRVALGCAQTRFQVTPDLTTLGKIVGGGMPLAAYGGKREVMQHISPLGKVYQAGTLSGNPVSVAAGRATLELLDDSSYLFLEKQGEKLEAGLNKLIQEFSLKAHIQRVGAMICLFFHEGPVTNFDQAQQCDTERFARFFHLMLQEGIYLPPSQFESWFLGLQHDDSILNKTLDAARKALSQL